MKVKQPTWLLLGCQAHAFALLIKDLYGEKTTRCAWANKAYSMALMMSNTIASCEKVHTALREQQVFKYGSVKQIRTNCPTRFAILHFICCDLLKSEDAIRLMVASRDWAKVSEGSTHAREFTGAATVVPGRGNRSDYYFFEEVAALVKLVQPVSDAIHQLESDQPLLSQMLPIWKQLLEHAKAFDEHEDNAKRAAVLPLFERRYEVHRDKTWPAAFALDPIHAIEQDGEWFMPLSKLSSIELQAAKACCIELGGVQNAQDIKTELFKLQLSPLPEHMTDALPMLTTRTTVTEGRRVKTKLADSTMRRGWWQTVGKESYPHLSKVAVRLLSFHVTACASERNWSLWGNVYPKCKSRLGLERGGKLVFIRGNDKTLEHKADEEVMLSLMEGEDTEE